MEGEPRPGGTATFIEGAIKKLTETETALLALSESPQGATSLRLVQRWKAELCHC